MLAVYRTRVTLAELSVRHPRGSSSAEASPAQQTFPTACLHLSLREFANSHLGQERVSALDLTSTLQAQLGRTVI